MRGIDRMFTLRFGHAQWSSQLRFFSKRAPCLALARDGQDDVRSCLARGQMVAGKARNTVGWMSLFTSTMTMSGPD